MLSQLNVPPSLTEQWRRSPQSAAPAVRSPASADVGLEMQAARRAAAGMQASMQPEAFRAPVSLQRGCRMVIARLGGGYMVAEGPYILVLLASPQPPTLNSRVPFAPTSNIVLIVKERCLKSSVHGGRAYVEMLN